MTVVVQRISENTKTVYNMIDEGENLILDENEKTIEMYNGDEKIGFSQIKTGDVIKAIVSKDKEYIKLLISSKNVSGIIERADKEGVVIDGTEYIWRMSESFFGNCFPEYDGSVSIVLRCYDRFGNFLSDEIRFDRVDAQTLRVKSNSGSDLPLKPGNVFTR